MAMASPSHQSHSLGSLPASASGQGILRPLRLQRRVLAVSMIAALGLVWAPAASPTAFCGGSLVAQAAVAAGGRGPRSGATPHQQRLHLKRLGGAGAKKKDSGPDPLETPWWQLETDETVRLLGPRMPFSIERVSPPPSQKLGLQLFDVKTSRGDMIRIKGTDDMYVVRRVRFLYDLVGGKYRIRRKVLEVATPARYVINEQLESLVEGKGGVQ